MSSRIKYRSRLAILVDILEVIAEGETKPTRIMYGANLSYDRLQKYLDYLIRMGLINEIKDNEEVRYRITEKGLQFIKDARRVLEFMRAFGLE